MKRFLAIALLAVFAVLSVAPLAHAYGPEGEYRIRDLKNVKLTSHNDQVRIEYTIEVVKGLWIHGSNDPVEIWRCDGQSKWTSNLNPAPGYGMSLQARIPVPQRTGEITVTWSDPNVEPGETYTYRIDAGEKYDGTITVRSGPPESVPGQEDEAGSGYIDQRKKELEDDVSWFQKMMADVILAIPNWLIKVLGLYDPIELVYMVDLPGNEYKPAGASSPADLPYLHVFTENEMESLAYVYDTITEYVPITLVVAIVLMGLGMLYSSANPQARIGVREYVLGLIAAVLLLKFGPQLLVFVFEVNYVIVKWFHSMADGFIQQSFLHSVFDPTTLTIGGALLAFIGVFAVAVLNFQYVMRKIIIALLIALIPLVAIIAIAPSKREVLGIWFKELVAAIFLQSAHAAVLTFLLLFIYAAGEGTANAFWIQIACLLGLPSLANLVRRAIGAETFGDSGIMSGVGAMFGLAALAAMGKMIARGVRTTPGTVGAVGTAAGATAIAAGTGALAGRAAGAAAGIGGAVIRGAATATGLMAGGLVAGAATGNPALGMVVGGHMGAAAGGRTQSFLLPRTAQMQGGVVADGSTVPSEVSQDVFGRDVTTNRPGVFGLKDSVAGWLRPEDEKAAYAAREHVHSLQGQLPGAKESMTQAKIARDYARAKVNMLKNMPMSEPPDFTQQVSTLEHRADALQKQKAGLEDRLYDVYSNAEQFNPNDPDSPYRSYHNPAADEIDRLQQTYARRDRLFQDTQRDLHVAKAQNAPYVRYQQHLENLATAQQDLRTAEYNYAQQQVAYYGLERNLSRDALKSKFEEIKRIHSVPRTKGNVDSPWR